MALFNNLSQGVTSLFTPRKVANLGTPPATPTPPGDDDLSLVKVYSAANALLLDEEVFEKGAFDDENEITLLNAEASAGTKRQRPSSSTKQKKRRRRNSGADYRGSDNESDNESDIDGPTLLGSSPITKAARDRQAMPPPPKVSRGRSRTPEKHTNSQNSTYTPDNRVIDRNLAHRIVRKENYDLYENEESSDEETLLPSNSVRKTDRREITFDYNTERAKRYAEANEASIESGNWSSQEKDLFTRLAMRGFEPLIPGHWYIDFNTFPSSLFSGEDSDPPLIEAHRFGEFRARTHLRSLVMMGMRARDRRLVGLHCEPVMRKIVCAYLDWALLDATLHPTQRPKTIPIHTITHQRPHEKTSAVITRITHKLSKLAKRYCDFGDILPSVEAAHSPLTSSHVRGTADEEDPRFPILTGFMICASIVAIVTLDSNPAFAPSPSIRDGTPQPYNTRPTTLDEAKTESGLRIIAMLDFSEDGMDVWNALAVAITIMRIRRTMQEMMEFMCGEGGTEKEARMWEMIEGLDGTGMDEDA